MLEAFRRGWERPEGEPPGFWVGRPHPPYTEVGCASRCRVLSGRTPRTYSHTRGYACLYVCVACLSQAMVVEGVDPADGSMYLKECPEGGKGFLVTRGRNLMAGYVQGEEATRK